MYPQRLPGRGDTRRWTSAANSTAPLRDDQPENSHKAIEPSNSDDQLDPGLYVVATPIGNLQDMTFRAVKVLSSVSLILAEDTRHSLKLLAHYGIKTPTLSYHSHNEKSREQYILRRLQQGEAIALISDAGTPAISDPGHAIVKVALEAGLRVVPVPGACAFVSAVVGSGLPTDRLMFCGFLPPKKGARQQALRDVAGHPSTLLFYAPPHGLVDVLTDLVEVLGPTRRCCIARELTKLHEEFFRSTLGEAVAEFTSQREAKGEICIVIEGATGQVQQTSTAQIQAALTELIDSGLPVSAAVKEVVSGLGLNKKMVYPLALKISQQLRAQTKQPRHNVHCVDNVVDQ